MKRWIVGDLPSPSMLLPLALAALSSCAFGDDVLPPAGAEPDYETHVRPVLVEHCTSCHSEDAQESMRQVPFFDDARQVQGQASNGVRVRDRGQTACRVVRRAVDELSMPPGAMRRLTPSERIVLRDFLRVYSEAVGECDEPLDDSGGDDDDDRDRDDDDD